MVHPPTPGLPVRDRVPQRIRLGGAEAEAGEAQVAAWAMAAKEPSRHSA